MTPANPNRYASANSGIYQTLNQRWQDECYRIGYRQCSTIPDLYIEISQGTGSVTYATPNDKMTTTTLNAAHNAGMDIMFLYIGITGHALPDNDLERSHILSTLANQFNAERDIIKQAMINLETTWELCAKQLMELPSAYMAKFNGVQL